MNKTIQISPINTGFKVHRNAPELRHHIYDVFEKYYVHNDRSEDVFYEEIIDRRKDVVVEDVDRRIENANCHDEDLKIFNVFQNPEDLILDIGANWGYSVIDIWAYGSKCKILSFEPVKFYSPLFQRIKDLCPGRYDYRILALFDAPSSLVFSVPVINNLPVFALASATKSPDLNIMTNNVMYHIDNYMRDDEIINVRMHEFSAQVDTLDNQLSNIKKTFSWNNIAAIKIDVEGLEFPVIRGAQNTIRKYKPLIMLEGGNRWPGLSEFLGNLGYVFAEREGDRLIIKTDTIGSHINGFFVHNDRINEYQLMGILSHELIKA